MLTLWRPTTTQEKRPQTLAQHNHLVLSHTHSGCTMGGLESCLGSTRLSPKKLAVAGLPAGAQSSAQAQEPSRDTAGGQPVRPEPPRVAIPRQPSRAQVGVGPSRADMVSGCVNGCTGSHKLLASECVSEGCAWLCHRHGRSGGWCVPGGGGLYMYVPAVGPSW